MSHAETFIENMLQSGGWICKAGIRHYIDDCPREYAEGQGYDQPQTGVLTANWNDHDGCRCMSRIAKLAESAGYECEWSDEWTACSDCGKLLRTQPDSYGWRPQYADGEGEILCRECADPHNEIRACIGNAHKSLPDWIVPEEYGYHAINRDGFETGMHPGQNDRPESVAERLEAAGVKRYLFSVSGVGQFDVSWNVYVRTRDMKRARIAFERKGE